MKLNPCPTCGGEAHKVMHDDFGAGLTYYSIICLNDECDTKTINSNIEGAIEDWNARKGENEK